MRPVKDNRDYRMAVFGASNVGKSSLLLRFIEGRFRETYIPTIEDVYRKTICCNEGGCSMLITDTTGAYQFPAMQRLWMTKGHAFIFVFSVIRKQSLEELVPIYEELCEIKDNLSEVPIILVGNKSDKDCREISEEEGLEMAKKWNCAYLETSAKNNHNVTEIFQRILDMETRRQLSFTLNTQKVIKKKEKKKRCSIM
ncbi:unnamed protein product [Owenia fusiformis]|uniref:Uncharacterized protein n=1 Tax=Owenia fusiformis TaxID=6347 RepID=A0A8J1UWR8_OWEFU|nr:unnamed protein product [Owenia fusiformis]